MHGNISLVACCTYFYSLRSLGMVPWLVNEEMEMVDYYIQCKLRKRNTTIALIPNYIEDMIANPHYSYQTAWIDANLAIIGKYVRIKTDDPERPWDDGWEVMETYDKVEARYIKDHERDYRNLFGSTKIK